MNRTDTKMQKSTLYINNLRLKPYQIHKFRGFIGNLFADYDLIHNHDPVSGKNIYRYPLIQFKLINGKPALIAITDEAVKIFTEIFMRLDQVVIDQESFPVYEKDLKIETVSFGYAEKMIGYAFESPWIALNQANYKRYIRSGQKTERHKILERALTGNILSMAKYLDCWLEKTQRVKVRLNNVRERRVNLKGNTLFGFTGAFKTNFIIPDYLGLGKSVSRGFGTVRGMKSTKAYID